MKGKNNKSHDNMRKIMQDVLLALLPIAAISYFAYGWITLSLIAIAVSTALAVEFIFSLIFKAEANSVRDGSALITAVLLTFTLAPFTPWYVVAFGVAMAVIFGKLLWGGMGKNKMNPALLGREFMTVFFPVVMSSRTIWYNKDLLQFKDLNFFGFLGENSMSDILNYLFFNPSGAIGEYSIILLVLGGLFLLVRKRITWHIPFGITFTFFVLIQIFQNYDLRFSLGGVMLGAIFMATDMPTCAKTKSGKVYYGAMIAITAVLFLLNNVRYEYMSYSILLMNLFAKSIDKILKPQEWSSATWVQQLGKTALLTTVILASAYLVAFIHHYIGIEYLLFGFIIYILFDFVKSSQKWQKSTA
jgi:electron transport complex protein RnfD